MMTNVDVGVTRERSRPARNREAELATIAQDFWIGHGVFEYP